MLTELLSALATLPPAVDVLVKLTALLAVAWLVKPILGRANPRWQVFYWRGVTAAALLMPLVVFLGPTVPVPLLPEVPAEPRAVTIQTPGMSPVEHGSADLPPMPGHAGPGVAVVAEHEAVDVSQEFGRSSGPTDAAAVAPISAPSAPFEWRPETILLAVWLLPALGLLAGVLFTERRVTRLIRKAEAAPAETGKLLGQVARDLGYNRSIRVCISPEVDSPRVSGTLQPAIILPKGLDTRGPSDLRGIFAHEINHLASHDLAWSRVIQALSIGLWFHPLVWGLRRQHLDACERACDAVAAEYVGDAYAGTLARVALSVIDQRHALAGIAMARKPGIRDRLLRLEEPVSVTPLRRRHVVPVAITGLILLTTVGGLRLVEARGPEPIPAVAEAPTSETPTADEQTPAEGSDAKQPEPTPDTQYACKVVDVVTGEPVAGATVTVQRRISGGGKSFREWPMKRETDYTTDAAGQYTIDIRPDEADERYLYVEVRIKHPNYVGWYAGYSYGMIKKNLKMGSQPFFKKIEVWPAVTLTGKVVTPAGQPAAGVEVFGYSKFDPEKFEPRGFFMEGKTDDEGIFELNAVRGGKSVVWLSPKEYCPSTHIVERRLAELGKTAIDHLQPGAQVPDAPDDATKTRDLGRLVLEEGVEIQGRLADVDGTPIEGVWVNARLQEGPAKKEIGMSLADHIDRSALTDADGRYRMGPLPPSTYRVTPWPEPSERSIEDRTPRPVPAEFFPKKVTLEDGMETATVDLQAVPSVTIVAQYYNSSGKPRTGHGIDISGKHEGEFYWKRCPADTNGRIEFTAPVGLEEARLNLITNEHSALRHRVAKDGPLKNERSVELGTLSSDMKEIAIIRYVAPILLIGAVAEDSKPIKDVWVKLMYGSDRSPRGGSQYIRDDRPSGHVSLEEHGDGRWRTSQLLPDEEVTLTVEADGYESKSETLSLPEGETREIEVTLKKAVEEKE